MKAKPLAGRCQTIGLWKSNRAVIAAVCIGGLLLVFAALGVKARSPELLRFDTEVTRRVQTPRSAKLDFLAYCFTFLGNEAALALVCAGTALQLKRAGCAKAAGFTVLTLVSVPLNFVIKLIFNRPRPTPQLVRVVFPDFGSSFPSGHAMCSVIVYGFLAFLACTYFQDRRWQRFWTAVFILTSIGISLSRIYLGVHWFSDVLGGALLGAAILLVLIKIYLWTSRAEFNDHQNTLQPQ